jgi:hypothetical protein
VQDRDIPQSYLGQILTVIYPASKASKNSDKPYPEVNGGGRGAQGSGLFNANQSRGPDLTVSSQGDFF